MPSTSSKAAESEGASAKPTKVKAQAAATPAAWAVTLVFADAPSDSGS